MLRIVASFIIAADFLTAQTTTPGSAVTTNGSVVFSTNYDAGKNDCTLAAKASHNYGFVLGECNSRIASASYINSGFIYKSIKFHNCWVGSSGNVYANYTGYTSTADNSYDCSTTPTSMMTANLGSTNCNNGFTWDCSVDTTPEEWKVGQSNVNKFEYYWPNDATTCAGPYFEWYVLIKQESGCFTQPEADKCAHVSKNKEHYNYQNVCVNNSAFTRSHINVGLSLMLIIFAAATLLI